MSKAQLCNQSIFQYVRDIQLKAEAEIHMDNLSLAFWRGHSVKIAAAWSLAASQESQNSKQFEPGGRAHASSRASRRGQGLDGRSLPIIPHLAYCASIHFKQAAGTSHQKQDCCCLARISCAQWARRSKRQAGGLGDLLKLHLVQLKCMLAGKRYLKSLQSLHRHKFVSAGNPSVPLVSCTPNHHALPIFRQPSS